MSKEGAGDSAKGRNGTDRWTPQHVLSMKRRRGSNEKKHESTLLIFRQTTCTVESKPMLRNDLNGLCCIVVLHSCTLLKDTNYCPDFVKITSPHISHFLL